MGRTQTILGRSKRLRRPRRACMHLGGLVCAVLLAAPITPAWAGAPTADASAVSVVGGFGVGDGIEALVDERDGALSFALPAGGLDLTWDSRAASGVGRFGLGAGWRLGLGAVQTSGGVQFSPASGGRYELDTSHASGLHGYGARDIAFRVDDDGRLPERADAELPERAYRYRLHELGGTVTSFDEAGDPVRGADGTTYAYDAANRPISRTLDGKVVQTSYWGDGSRRSLTRVDEPGADPVQTTYYWDGATLVNDVHAESGAGSAGGEAASYLLGATRHARTIVDGDGRRTAYLGTDRHGNVTDLTDDGGAVQTRYAYSDYGVQTIESAGAEGAGAEFAGSDAAPGLARNPFGYAGEQTDDDGSLYLRARVYEPRTMRFTSEDPAERFDRYNYADLNPIMMVDPSGRTPEWDEIVDLVTGGLALASLAGSAVMAAFTGGLSLTGLGIMGIASDVVTVLAVTARTVDRERPELGILDEDGQKMLLGVEIAFGAFGGVGFGSELRQLGTAERLHVVEKGADMLLDASNDVTGVLAQRAKLIVSEHYGAATRPHAGNISIDTELNGGDLVIGLARSRAQQRERIVEVLSTFNAEYANALDARHLLLRGYRNDHVLDKVARVIRDADRDQLAIEQEIDAAASYWAGIKADVMQARTAEPSTLVNGLPTDLPGSPSRRLSDGDPSRVRIVEDDPNGISILGDSYV